jgi:hypothetical protein
MKIIEFKNTNNIIIQFEDEHKYTKQTTYGNFLRGVIKNPYDKTICGVAYTGEGIHKISLGTKHLPIILCQVLYSIVFLFVPKLILCIPSPV